MGDPRKQHKKFERPRKLFDKNRIDAENELAKSYGLKNKREIWKTEFKINTIRRQAKELINNASKQKDFLEKLNKQGLKVKTIDDVLGLKKEDLLERRLQTVLVKKGLAKTLKHARQLIVHKHVLVSGRAVNVPSYLITLELEKELSLKKKSPKKKIEKAEKQEEEQN